MREEWAQRHGLPYFLTSKFTDSIEAVRSRMGVATDAIKHNIPNQKLMDAAIKLGYHAEAIPVRPPILPFETRGHRTIH